jgi:hypothetical protein
VSWSSGSAGHRAAALWLPSFPGNRHCCARCAPQCCCCWGPPCQPFLAFGKGGGTCSYRCREVCAGRLGFQVSCCGMCSYVSNLLGLACSCVSSLLSSFFWSKKFQFKATFSRGLASDSTLMLCSSVGNRYGSGIIFQAFGLTADYCLSSDLMIGEMKLISHVR